MKPPALSFFNIHWLPAILSACLLMLTQKASAQEATSPVGASVLRGVVQEVIPVDTILKSSSQAKNEPSRGHVRYLFTEEDIRHMPVRDVLELLNTIPGITIGTDVGGVLQLGVRGSVAGEATAMIVDGVILNEGMYATFQLAGKFQLDQIRQMEVIFSPDPIYFGGWACYAAIVIQTRAYTPFNGLRTAWTQGFNNPSNDARVASCISIGKYGPDWSIAVTGSVASSVLSFRKYTDINGNSFEMSQNSGITSRFGSVRIGYKQTSITVVSDYYQMTTRDAYVNATTQAYRNDFITFDVTARHQIHVNDRFKLNFLSGIKSQDPYRSLNEVASQDSASYVKLWMRYNRFTAASQLSYALSPRLQLLAGLQAVREWGFDFEGYGYFSDHTLDQNFNCFTATGQAHYQGRFTFLTASMRADRHSYAGSLMSPSLRGGFNIGPWFVNAGYTSAARLPSILNIAVASSEKTLATERVETIDLQTGIQISNGFSASVRAFHSLTTNGVAYLANDDGEESYRNVKPFGSQGCEISVRKSKGKIRYQLSYGNYHSLHNQTSSYCQVEGKSVNLAMPGQKGSASISVPLHPDLTASVMAIFQGSRYGVVGPNPASASGSVPILSKEYQYSHYPADLTLNLFLHYKVGITEGLEISLGIVDILNQGTQYVQPYAGFHMPLPGPTREYIVRICYALER